MKKEIIILVGNIGTGKTTIAKELKKDGYIIIARDMLRYAIGGGEYIFNYYYEPTIWSTELYMFKKFTELGVSMIIDEVGMNRTQRARYIQYAKTYGYMVTVMEMPKLTMKEAVDRRLKNPHCQPDRKLWEQIWKKFNKMYEKPTKKEGIDIIVRAKNV